MTQQPEPLYPNQGAPDFDVPYSNPQIEEWPVGRLRPNPNNPRTHDRKQIRKLAESFRTFGFLVPIIVDGEGEIVAGHGRLMAAQELKRETVPVIRANHLTDAMKKAFRIADNRIAELAGWDRHLLAIEIQELDALDLNFSIEVTGFDTPEIDILIGETANEPEPEAAVELPPEDTVAVTRTGDVWFLGDHRLLCGDALEEGSYEVLMGGERAEMVFTDPPYNLKIPGTVSGLGKVVHRDFAMASGEMSEAEFTKFLSAVFRIMVAHSRDGAIHFLCIDWRHQLEMLTAGRETYSELKNLIVWAKTNAGMGTFYRSQHELVYAWKAGASPHINNFELGQHGRHRSNVWEYAGVNTFRSGREDELAMHPTVKPVALVADAIRDCSRRKGIVLDPFVGSGTTVLATELTGRRARAMEIDPVYVDVAVRRWEDVTGQDAVHTQTGRTFAETAAERARPPVRHRSRPGGQADV